ncbi:sensor histidine kinase [Anaeromyxobacter sp. SG64]|uniref:sensor histidine kinase n=1 Tax=Anaeromyxobacter sp. SG64 TaxID=2925409 RepID=UPI001F567962|nr:ATP-binding protein [Anaeromyxobacter sp. SG64]
MSAGAASPDLEVGFEASCLARERWEGTTAVVLSAVLIPLWIVFDALLEPEWVQPFTAMRLVATAVASICVVAIRRARTTRGLRAWVVLALAVGGASIALMLPHVRHFPAYVFGFSLFFWGAGAMFSWPARWSLALFGFLLAVMSSGFAVWPDARELADFVAAGFYIGSAGVIATIMTLVRSQLVRDGFVVSHELAMRNADVERTLEQLRDAQARLVASEKLTALGRLLAGLSHEINNPLNVLHNNLDPLGASLGGLLEVARAAEAATAADLPALRRRCAELDVDTTSKDVRDATEMMRAAMERVRQVHADLRAFIRGDAPGMVLGDPGEGLRATATLLSRRLPEAVRVEVDVGPLPRTAFQPGQLNQVWHNLVQNALDAVGDAGTVTVRARAVGDRIEVTVADSGPGVAREHQARLFEPFFTTKGVGKGTGLGLAMSYQIVERHGGAMFLDGGYTNGARFVIQLPVRAASALPVLAGSDPGASRRAG